METYDKDTFGKEWAAALGDASLAPSPAVWEQVDAALVMEENIIIRGRYTDMRNLAAAAVLLLLVTAGSGYYFWNKAGDLERQLAFTDVTDKDISDNTNKSGELASLQGGEDAGAVANESESNLKDPVSNNTEDRRLALTEVETDPATSDQQENGSDNVFTSLPVTNKSGEEQVNAIAYLSIGHADQLGFTEMASLGDPELRSRYMIYFLPEEPEEPEKRTVWAGLDMGGGQFSPDTEMGGLAFSQAEADYALNNGGNTQERIDGASRAFGLGVGTTLSDRFLLKSGMRYSSVTSGIYSGSDPSIVASSLSVTKSNFDRSNSTNSLLRIEENNFLSVPLEAGYYVLKGKFSISLNPGIDSRFYLNRNVEQFVSGSATNTESAEMSSLSLWGQFGTDFSLKLGDNYQVVVSPSYKLALTSLEKDADVYPNLKQVSFSMRYLFNK